MSSLSTNLVIYLLFVAYGDLNREKPSCKKRIRKSPLWPELRCKGPTLATSLIVLYSDLEAVQVEDLAILALIKDHDNASIGEELE